EPAGRAHGEDRLPGRTGVRAHRDLPAGLLLRRERAVRRRVGDGEAGLAQVRSAGHADAGVAALAADVPRGAVLPVGELRVAAAAGLARGGKAAVRPGPAAHGDDVLVPA